ncbi:hypothetical protein DPMN_160862 [Dreissena polymorpha]|uniref:Uncharacterized protein n=1 Tax=Dreissena polymorpha TaxID=45954 RepID=A0A9D4EPB1_DREPO|nr:hypothetical protein DPMN_160862 [Dreissena polymorpha]
MWTDGWWTKTNPKTSPEQSTIFQLVREINKTNAKNVTSIMNTAPPPWRPYIYKTNLFTKFHDDWAKNVTSIVFTRTGTTFELNQHIIKTNILTNFELDRDFIGTKLLTKFHEDQTINVASKVFTNKCIRRDGRTMDKDRSQKLT